MPERDGVLVGRRDALRRLNEHLEAERRVLVFGEPGIGKTALVRAAVERAGRRIFEGGPLAGLRWSPYFARLRRTTAGDG